MSDHTNETGAGGPDTASPATPAVVAAHLEEGEEVLHFQRGDLTPGRRFGESWVALTGSRLIVAAGDGVSGDGGDDGGDSGRGSGGVGPGGNGAGPVRSYPLADLKEVRVEELYGSARLVAVRKRRKGEEHLLTYTRRFVPEFAALCQVVGEHLKGKGEKAVRDETEPAFCPKCGAPMPERGGVCSLCVRRVDIFRRLLGLTAPYRSRVWMLMGVTVLTVLAQMAPPLITRSIVDEVIIGRQLDLLEVYIGALVASGLLLLAGRFFSGRLTSWIGGRLTADLRSRMHRLLQRLQLSYFQRRDSGEIVNRVMNDTAELRQFLVEGVPFFLVNSISFVAIAVILVVLDPGLALLVFLPVPFLLGGGRWFWRKLTPLFHKTGTRRGALHGALNESIHGIKIVKAFSREEERSERFDHDNRRLFDTEFLVARTFVTFSELMFWVMTLGVAAVWFFATRRIAAGGSELTLGTLLAFVGYIWLFYGPLQWFTAVMNWMSHAFTGAERIFSLLDSETETGPEGTAATVLPEVRGAIRFEDVHFSYERGKEVIKGMKLRIAPGEMIGLVGKSGAGKSTMINLLARFYRADSGRITIDGVPVNDLDLEQLRRNIGMVPQETYLFNASILDNIRYGKPGASFAEVVRAARAANAHEFILSKDDGYDTLVGERGAMLSGGEKQRLAIARAILHDPPILILDEATSSVDSETEKAIQEAIRKLVKGRTTIAIAHRLPTLRHADRLVVVEGGKIVEQGSHKALLARKNGHFAKLVKAQSEIHRLRARASVWEE